jgi:hypothetical protein
MNETWSRDGGRCIELFVPIEFLKAKIDAVTIRPVKLDHFLRWESGEISTALALLSELTGLQQAALRQINYPDIERVMAAFVNMLPAKIAENINRGEVPVAGNPTVPLSPVQQAALEEEMVSAAELPPPPQSEEPAPAEPSPTRRGNRKTAITALPADDQPLRDDTGFNLDA